MAGLADFRLHFNNEFAENIIDGSVICLIFVRLILFLALFPIVSDLFDINLVVLAKLLPFLELLLCKRKEFNQILL